MLKYPTLKAAIQIIWIFSNLELHHVWKPVAKNDYTSYNNSVGKQKNNDSFLVWETIIFHIQISIILIISKHLIEWIIIKYITFV
jgi:hypothetical protein